MNKHTLVVLCLSGGSALGCATNADTNTPPLEPLSDVTASLEAYYQSVDATNATTLRATLHATIKDHQRFPYTSSATDTWNILDQADQNPNSPNSILDVYRNASYPKAGGGNTNYDREHVWPNSYGFPNDNNSNYPYTDCHLLFLSDSGYNSSRSNNLYDTCDASCTEKPTLLNNTQGGGTGVYPGNSNWRSPTVWEAWNGRRGDVARALFYVDVRYEGGVHGITGASEPDLILTNNANLVVADTQTNKSTAYMGILSTLLQWHLDDPVSAQEQQRNNVIASYQGNRNPFIDHPEWVACVFLNSCGGSSTSSSSSAASSGSSGAGGSGGGTGGAGGSSGGVTEPWINEIHYDNTGSDQKEGVEIAGLAGTSLAGYQLLAYNGSNGLVYTTVQLDGTFADAEGGAGAIWFKIDGLQNGSPDGLALVGPSGNVIQYLSYEGPLTANDGPAAGLTSVDIGVEELADTPRNQSLQLVGTGCGPGDFQWSGPSNETAGSPNANQTFACN